MLNLLLMKDIISRNSYFEEGLLCEFYLKSRTQQK